MIFIELWNHGTADEAIKPCGEVDIFCVTGERIPYDALVELTSDERHGPRFEWFGHLPTEQALLVEAELSIEDGDIWMFVKAFSYLPIPDSDES